MDPNDTKLAERIAQHSLMLEEFERQKHDLTALAEIKSTSDLARFKRYAMDPEHSNIGLKIRSSARRR